MQRREHEFVRQRVLRAQDRPDAPAGLLARRDRLAGVDGPGEDAALDGAA